MNYELYNHTRGLTIKISGYSDQQSRLLSKVLNALKFAKFDSERFQIIKERLKRKLRNSKDKKPFQQAISQAQNLLIYPSWNEQQRLEQLENIKLGDIRKFHSDFLAKLDLAILSGGNITRATTLNTAKLIEAVLLKSASKTSVERAKVVKLSKESKWLNRFDIDHKDTGFFHYLQGTDKSYQERAKFLLLTQVLSSSYYNQVRTEKQLGYVVFATNFELLEVPGLAFIVQSPNTLGDALSKETDDFLASAIEIFSEMDISSLEQHKQSVISRLLKKDNTLYERSNRFWRDIDVLNHNFNTSSQLASEVSKLSKEQLVDMIKGINQNTNSSLTVYSQSSSDNKHKESHTEAENDERLPEGYRALSKQQSSVRITF